ncbi:hypothetical protein BV898_16311 [Hypsibius exemplaris]|uniref:Uncharacterized protein n=1 Tax=Hypsibius exemplaris TaxID=2072580 RepID=A0A9X6NLR0_HYPEX|nr:hypothetical protein BV898_16311 [Hypsibius exemplaris]
MGEGGLSEDSWSRLERRISRLEEATGANKLSPHELSKVVHELLDLRQSFNTQMNSHPTIQTGLQKYHVLLKMAEEQEGNAKGSSGLKRETLLNELPRLRGLASSTEELHQLEAVLDLTSSDDLNKRMARLGKMKQELLELLEQANRIERIHGALSTAQFAAVSLAEDKLLDINSRLP